MAILITSKAIVKTVNPIENHFTLDELNSFMKGWISPIKIGPLWIIHKETKTESFNDIASTVFNMPLYGSVLVVPVQQLPQEWGLVDVQDQQYTAEEVDMGFLISLQTILAIMNGSKNDLDIHLDMKEEWLYDPAIEEDYDQTRSFFDEVFPFIVKEKEKLKEKILYEEEDLIIKVKNDSDMKKILEQMISVYVQDEEYEKCAEIQKIMNDFK